MGVMRTNAVTCTGSAPSSGGGMDVSVQLRCGSVKIQENPDIETDVSVQVTPVAVE